MSSRYKTFGVSVIIMVMLVGAGFGALTGVVYNQKLWWIAAISGGVCGYPLARIYLRSLKNSGTNARRRQATWFYGSCVASICGVICTMVVHATMMGAAWITTFGPHGPVDAYAWPTILAVGLVIGAMTGFVVGGICSLIFVLSVKVPNDIRTIRKQTGLP